MWTHNQLTSNELRRMLHQGVVAFGGNQRLRIYGTLHCVSGKRMKKENRVFFTSETEALQSGFRPCGNCLKRAYMDWKKHLGGVAL